MAIITISRQYGSGGDEIAELVCLELHYRLFDKRLIANAAREAGISDQAITDYSEDNYTVKSFFERLIGRSQPVAHVRTWREDVQGVRIAEEIDLSEEHAVNLVQRAVRAAHAAGSIVIVGRGGQVILKNEPDVFHVRIEAPMEERIQRVKTQHRIKRREAVEMIGSRDAASGDYLKQFYNVDWSDPLLYHITLNTGMLELEDAAKLITEGAKRLPIGAVHI